MLVPKSFQEHVAMKFRLYGGLFFDLPFENVQTAGTTLPLFTQYCKESLALGQKPDTIVEDFFSKRLGIKDFTSIKERIFPFMQLIERQIVLFDAVEDAAFVQVRDLDGPGSLYEAGTRVAGQNLTEKAQELLDDYGIRIVLTAHPTQFYTEAVLGIIAHLREAIRKDDVQEVHKRLLQLGRTRFKKREKPSPLDEARAILWFMENILYEVVPQVHDRILKIAEVDTLTHRPLVELGFWPGGDRDGNPNVTNETTMRVAEMLRTSILELYERDIKNLQEILTFDGVSEALEVIRVKIHGTRKFHGINHNQVEGHYLESIQLTDDLMEVRRLLQDKHQGLFLEHLDAFLTRVRCFGFYFGILDLRQDSRVIAKAMEAVLKVLDPGKSDYVALSQEERLQRLSTINEAIFVGKYQSVLPTITDPVFKDCLEVLAAAQGIQERNGPQSIHRFIISNTNGPADLMAVRLLAICAGFNPQSLNLDLVPLFETVDDLANANKTMAVLWDLPLYRRHVATRNNVQHIMVGFSDGTKDGGYLSANWHIYRAKQSLTELSEHYGIRPVFFDGRGGPPARGGGNTHKFYRSLGRDIEGRTIHLTIQGQTISSTYGTPTSAQYNLEQLASAALDNYLYPQNEDWHLDAQEASLLDELSTISHGAYISLRDHKDFLPYIEHLSPLRYYAQANNSSRPTKRPGSGGLTLGDLRAIPFVGAWSQLKQNIPGYYGLGTALESLAKAGRLEELKALYQGSLYVRTLFENSMQSLSKVYLPLTSWVFEDPRFSAFHGLIVAEAERTKSMLLAVSGQDELLAEDPLNRASIRMREDLIVPMSVLQQYALIHLRRISEENSNNTKNHDILLPRASDIGVLEKIVVKTMATCVNASRNSV